MQKYRVSIKGHNKWRQLSLGQLSLTPAIDVKRTVLAVFYKYLVTFNDYQGGIRQSLESLKIVVKIYNLDIYFYY